jgi:hypothetical protein
MNEIADRSHAGYRYFPIKNGLSCVDMGPDKPISYIDNILNLARKMFEEHLAILEETLVRLGNAKFQVYVDRSGFLSKALKFFGFVLIPEEYPLIPKRVKAILAILASMNIKDVHFFAVSATSSRTTFQAEQHLWHPSQDLQRKTLSLHGRRSRKQLSV